MIYYVGMVLLALRIVNLLRHDDTDRGFIRKSTFRVRLGRFKMTVAGNVTWAYSIWAIGSTVTASTSTVIASDSEIP